MFALTYPCWDGLIVIQVLLWTYLHHALPRFDAELMMNLKGSIEELPAGKDRDDLLVYLAGNPQLSNSTLTKARSQNGRLVMAPHIWRQQVQKVVHEIIAPDSLHWMDDDDAISVSHVCRRSLQEVQIRYEQ